MTNEIIIFYYFFLRDQLESIINKNLLSRIEKFDDYLFLIKFQSEK